jgi:hypothetical protein
MALSINQVLSEGASTVCFEVSTDATGDAIVGTTIIDPTLLTGAGDNANQTITITRIVASVGRATAPGGVPARVTLSWGEPNDQTEFLHIPDGAIIDLNLAFAGDGAGNPGGCVSADSTAGTVFTLRIFAKKTIGFPLSMGHARHRP